MSLLGINRQGIILTNTVFGCLNKAWARNLVEQDVEFMLHKQFANATAMIDKTTWVFRFTVNMTYNVM